MRRTAAPAAIFRLIVEHGVTHMCGAPTVLGLLASAPAEQQRPFANVVHKPGATATEAELVEWCRERIAHYKVPRKVVFGAIPTTATGKIQKFVLRETARVVE